VLLDQAVGVWLDGFLDEWFSEEVILEHLDSGKKVCIVSPELHGRDHQVFWRNLRQMTVSSSKSVMLCTDYPELARKFFNEQD
jgi:hypothetical protein